MTIPCFCSFSTRTRTKTQSVSISFLFQFPFLLQLHKSHTHQTLSVSILPHDQKPTLLIISRFHQQQMYPKVKVRTEGCDDQHGVHQHNWSSLLSLKDIQFLSIQDTCFPVKGHRDVSPSPAARIPKSYVPNVVMPIVSVSEGEDKESSSDEENRPNIRASSLPRPRAVLSSTDNDAMIGNKNRVKAERSSALKNQRLIQSRHAQCNIIPSPVIYGNPINTKRSKDATDNKGEIKGRKRISNKSFKSETKHCN